MRKATKRSVIVSCVFTFLSGINLLMEYRKTTPGNLTLLWIMFIFLLCFSVMAFIRFKKTEAEGN